MPGTALMAPSKRPYPRLETFKGRLGESASTLLECLELNDSLASLTHRIRLCEPELDQDKRVGESQKCPIGFSLELPSECRRRGMSIRSC